MKQGLFFENCRMTTIDSNGILKYYTLSKKDQQTARSEIDLKNPVNAFKFLYKQQHKLNGEFTVITPKETFIFRDMQKATPNPDGKTDPLVRDWELMIRNFIKDVQVKV